MEKTNSKGIVLRFAIVYFIVVIGFSLVVWKIVHIQYVERDNWMALSDSLRRVDKKIDLEPNRGNIYSCNGELMASTVPSYYLYMDFLTPALRKNDGKMFFDNLDSLSYCLSKTFKDKSEGAYRRHLLKGYHQHSRHYRVSRKKVSHALFKEVKRFPLYRYGYRSGLIAEKRIKRIKPYGSLASIVVGNLYGDKSQGATNGLEAAFDSILKGKSGKGHLEKRAGVNILVADKASENGADIVTTINIDMQDIAEKALRDKLMQLNAEFGCVVLMEVKTGQIKAIVNLIQCRDSMYYETENKVLTSAFEPGSTQKIPSLMVALEDGVIKPNDTVDCGDGIWKFNDEVKITDHNTGDRSNGKIPVSQAIVRSSNVGVAKVIYEAYKDDPQEFVDAIKEMGMGIPIGLGYSEDALAKPLIQGPSEKVDEKGHSSWGSSDLASMSYGYTINLPLLNTLTFYNAIANNGKMVQPYLVKKIVRNGEILQESKPVVLKKSICSKKTLEEIKDMMLQVVEDKEHGTGKKIKSNYVQIAGKTGTARYNYNKKWKTRHQVSFCGFYPYDDPEYSCIVFIRNPRRGTPSGGNMAGPVFKEIAERVMASHSLMSIDKYKVDTTKTMWPFVKRGNFQAANKVLTEIGLLKDNNTIDDIDQEIVDGVPSVKGMGVIDAIYLLESKGMRVQMEGVGKIVYQSIKPGTPIVKGTLIKLKLKN